MLITKSVNQCSNFTENGDVSTTKISNVKSGEEKVLTTKAPETETVSEGAICSFFFNRRHCS